MIELCANKIITDLENGQQYLILWLAPGNEYGYWYGLSNNSRTPVRFSTSDLIDSEEKGHYEISDYVASDWKHDDTSLAETERFHRDRIWEMLRGAVECEPDIYDKKCRASILRRIADENNMQPNNLYRYLDKYWRSGKTKNAFLPQYFKCGGKGKERPLYKRNAERTNDAQFKTIDETDRQNFAKAIKKYYLTQKSLHSKQSTNDFCRIFIRHLTRIPAN